MEGRRRNTGVDEGIGYISVEGGNHTVVWREEGGTPVRVDKNGNICVWRDLWLLWYGEREGTQKRKGHYSEV